MTTYQYQAKDGTRIEEEHSMLNYPKHVTRRGVRYELVITGGELAKVRQLDHIACSLPPWTPGAREYVTDPKHEHYGQPIVSGLRDIRNIEAATDGKYSYNYRTDRSDARRGKPRR